MTRRKTDPAPWGFSATTWQAFAFLLLGMLALTNAAWFYSIRVAKAEAAAVAPAPEPRRVERVVYQTPDGRPAQAPRSRPAPTPVPSQQRQRPLAAMSSASREPGSASTATTGRKTAAASGGL